MAAACILAFAPVASLKGAEVVVVTFEGLVPAPPGTTRLSQQIPGLTFRGWVDAFDPAEIGNSAGLPLSAATSGTGAASALGAMTLQFATPVTYVSANISPGFLTIGNVTAFGRVDLIGYDIELNERARTIVPLLAAAATLEQAQSFQPELIELRSDVPLAYVTFRFDIGRMHFDDFTYIHATPREIEAPLPPPRRWKSGTFEGLLKPWETYVQLREIIPGVTFQGDLYVHDPGYVGNSPSINLSPATSGNAAATTFRGGTMLFARPVREVRANVSPSFIALNGVSGFVRVEMVGYDRNNIERARSAIQLRASAATREEIESFVPQEIVLQSKVPLNRVALSFDIGRIYLDDFSIKHVERPQLKAQPAKQPWKPPFLRKVTR